MEQQKFSNAISYLLLLATFFLILLVLDKIFGVSYEPDRLKENRPKLEKEAEPVSYTTRPESTEEIVASADLEVETSEDESEDGDVTKENVSGTDEGSYFSELKKNYKSEILSKLPSKKARTDVVIRYYRHPPDGKSAYALEKLKYYIHERPVNPAYTDFQSNAIYYGDSVSLTDIQLVAYTLLDEGLPIKVIKPSMFGDTWKARSIEIGTDTTLVDQPTLKLTEIKNLSI